MECNNSHHLKLLRNIPQHVQKVGKFLEEKGKLENVKHLESHGCSMMDVVWLHLVDGT